MLVVLGKLLEHTMCNITFSCSTQLSTKFILLINVKMSTIVGILTFISMIRTTFERLKAINFFICQYFSFYEQLKFHAHLSWAWKEFYNLGAWWPCHTFLAQVILSHQSTLNRTFLCSNDSCECQTLHRYFLRHTLWAITVTMWHWPNFHASVTLT